MTVKRVNEIVAQMRAALSVGIPDLDTTIGSPIRKVLDAVGEVVAEAYVDGHLLDYTYDLDSKTGTDLDDFVRLFGFTRFPAKRANGTVIFSRSSAATDDVMIPVGTQLSTDGTVPAVVQTTVPALLLQGETSVQVPVQAVVGGTEGNIPANTIKRRLSNIEGIGDFGNPNALSGGADPESDEQLRDRFRNSVFRSMAGTEHMFLGIALDDPAVTHANVIGAAKTRRESIELVSGEGTSTIQDAAYIYPDSQSFGVNLDVGDLLTPGVHYTFDSNVIPPEVESIHPSVPDGVYDLSFEYVPLASRNDPPNGITNRIDIYVNGQRPVEANETAVFRLASLFVAAGGSQLSVANFERADGSPPVADNFFLPFAFAPVIDPSVSGVIEIDGTSYTEGVDFWLVNDITNMGGTPVSLSGIEIQSSANGGPSNPTDESLVALNYIFNSVPRDIEVAARAWSLITTDARVHQAKPIRLNLNMAVILEQGYPIGSIQSQLEAEFGRFIDTIGFHGVVQISDLMEVGMRVPGVDAIRFLRSTDDAVDYAIQRVNSLGNVTETYQNGGRPIDVLMADDEYPLFNSLRLEQRAQNTFGQV